MKQPYSTDHSIKDSHIIWNRAYSADHSIKD